MLCYYFCDTCIPPYLHASHLGFIFPTTTTGGGGLGLSELWLTPAACLDESEVRGQCLQVKTELRPLCQRLPCLVLPHRPAGNTCDALESSQAQVVTVKTLTNN